jgi:hypothetical protein
MFPHQQDYIRWFFMASIFSRFRWNGRKTDTAGRIAQLLKQAGEQHMPYSLLVR